MAFASLVLPVAGFVACVGGATAGGPQPGHGDIMKKGLNWPTIRKDGWCYGVLAEKQQHLSLSMYIYIYIYRYGVDETSRLLGGTRERSGGF